MNKGDFHSSALQQNKGYHSAVQPSTFNLQPVSQPSQHSRTAALLGANAMKALADSKAVVVGVGGVGSWCAEALVRTGIGKIVLVDDDVVAPSNLNRQCPATVASIGRKKVEAMRDRLKAINPECEVVAKAERYVGGGMAAFKNVAVVVDAIDSVDCKAALILDTFAANVPVVSSMGAALRTDPTKVRITDFAKVEGDGLARALRQRFKRLGKYPGKFKAVWSAETPRCEEVEKVERVELVEVLSQPPQLSQPALGSVMMVTATFGMCLAKEAIECIIKKVENVEKVEGEKIKQSNNLKSNNFATSNPQPSQPSQHSHHLVLSLGSNIEPRAEYLHRARDEIAKFPTTLISTVSEVVETEPQDVPAEFAAMKFLNQVLLVKTELQALEFSRLMHGVEDALGRIRSVRNGPRTIDIDMIDYDGIVLRSPSLTLPHPRANEREFVIEPWKQAVRKEVKMLRRQVSAEERAKRSHEVCQALFEQIGNSRIVCAYEALKTELDISEFVALCRQQGIEVVVPEKVESVENVENVEKIKQSQPPQHSQPPKHSYFVNRASEVDLWVCPGLAFTDGGKRVGFGGGWYDRFLALVKPSARKIGVGYAFQRYPNLPQGPFDRLLDEVIFV